MDDLRRLSASLQDIEDCIDVNLGALAHCIRDCGRSSPPGDGAISRVLGNLRALAEIRNVLTAPPLPAEPTYEAEPAPTRPKRGRPRKQKEPSL
ncbi:MAG: hypothetical protein KA472_11335 [Pseudomonadales bacterium]|nr:hypothetical protein [Pseudomonadales bacterium]